MKKNILVKLFLELIVEERRGPVEPIEVCDPFDVRLCGTTHYIKDNPDCIRLVMDKLNEIGLSDESIIKSFNDFIDAFEKEIDESYTLQYVLIKIILGLIERDK